jgi:hypothetical protein
MALPFLKSIEVTFRLYCKASFIRSIYVDGTNGTFGWNVHFDVGGWESALFTIRCCSTGACSLWD